jgi:CrcB protein
MLTSFILVCLCGGLGAVARFILDTSIQRWWSRAFPLSTLIITAVGAFCVGLAAAAFMNQAVDMRTYLLFVIGFFGGFSTFSTAVNQMTSLVRGRRQWSAVAYLAVTILASLACIALGWWLGSLAH